jgi:hypothetical protein
MEILIQHRHVNQRTPLPINKILALPHWHICIVPANWEPSIHENRLWLFLNIMQQEQKGSWVHTCLRKDFWASSDLRRDPCRDAVHKDASPVALTSD